MFFYVQFRQTTAPFNVISHSRAAQIQMLQDREINLLFLSPAPDRWRATPAIYTPGHGSPNELIGTHNYHDSVSF